MVGSCVPRSSLVPEHEVEQLDAIGSLGFRLPHIVWRYGFGTWSGSQQDAARVFTKRLAKAANCARPGSTVGMVASSEFSVGSEHNK
jgi:hypothetical protein